jgi:hypothetical protein
MYRVARPCRLALLALAGCWGIGGAAQPRRWWQVSRAAPAHGLALGGGIALLEPPPPSGLESGDLPQPGGRGRSVDGPQPLAAVRPHVLGQGIAGGLLRRQARRRKPLAVASTPHRRHPGLAPGRCGGGQHVERSGSGWRPGHGSSRCVGGLSRCGAPARETTAPSSRTAGVRPDLGSGAGGTRAEPRQRSRGRSHPGPGRLARQYAPGPHPLLARPTALRHMASR